MSQVFKYPLQLNDEVALDLPKNAEVLCVQVQREQPYLWAVVDPDAETERRVFRIARTGHPLGDANQMCWISTFQIYGGHLVFHVFEVIPWMD